MCEKKLEPEKEEADNKDCPCLSATGEWSVSDRAARQLQYHFPWL